MGTGEAGVSLQIPEEVERGGMERRREEWAAKYAEIIKPGGEIVSNVFPIGPFEGGPPFALSPDIVKSLLEPVGFEVVSLTETPETQWARGRPEFLYRFRRK